MLYPIYDKYNNLKCHIIIDKEDFKRIDKYTWRLNGRNYIKAKINKKDVYLHRYIMNQEDSKIIIDHKNNDPWDNRKRNLREATLQQNAFNRTKRINSTSKYKGVSFDKRRNLWESYYKIDGKKYSLGFFEQEKKAGKKYDQYAKILYGEFSLLNIYK